MNKCSAMEPAPTRFYAPNGMYTQTDLDSISAEWLGEIIISPGGSFRYCVASGPLCRLYNDNGRLQPHALESAYTQSERGRWKRSHSNYLSYQLVDGSFITVRWQSPMRQTITIAAAA